MRRIPLVPVVAALLLAAGAAPAGASGTSPGRNGVVAYTSRGQIYTISPAGTGMRQLTTAGRNSRPAWSPDGRRLAYLRQDATGADVWTMRADGSAQKRVTATHTVTGAASWSPDGARLYYGDQQAVYAVALATGVVRPLTACLRGLPDDTDEPFGTPCQPGQEPEPLRTTGGPVLSPDGRLLVTTTNGGIYDTIAQIWSGNRNYMYVLDADGGGGDYGRIGTTWSWSPDGRTVATAYYRQAGSNGEVDPPQIAFYARPTRVPAAPALQPRAGVSLPHDTEPSFSPDGTRLAVTNDAAGIPAVYIARLDSSGRRRLVAGAQPAWQPLPAAG